MTSGGGRPQLRAPRWLPGKRPTASVDESAAGATDRQHDSVGVPWVALSCVALLAMAALVQPVNQAAISGAPLVATSYNANVAALANSGFLTLESDNGPRAGQVTLTETGRANPVILQFVRESYLRSDLASAGEGVWEVRGRRIVGINPRLHNMTGPFAGTSGWTGNVQFRPDGQGGGQSAALLASNGQSIALSPRYRAVAVAGYVAALTGEQSGDVANQFELVDTLATRNVLAKVQMMGGHPLVTVQCRSSGPLRVTISSLAQATRSCREPRPAGVVMPDTITSALGDGDSIIISRQLENEPAMIYSFGNSSAAMSSFRPFGSRLNSDAAGGFGGQVAEAVDALMTGSQQSEASRTANLTLTIDRDLQSQVDRALLLQISELSQAINRSEQHPIAGAVTVLDAMTGDVLALGSAPLPRNAADGAAANVRRLTQTSTRNRNLVPMPVGSTAKVVTSAAILSRFPALRYLCAPASASGSFQTVLGVQLNHEINDEVVGGDVDFQRFIQKSSNRFGAALILLAAARMDENPAAGQMGVRPTPLTGSLMGADSYGMIRSGTSGTGANVTRTCGARQSTIPDFIFPREPGRDGSSPTRTLSIVPPVAATLRAEQGGTSWIDMMDTLYAMPRLEPDSETRGYDSTMWTPFWENLSATDTALADVSPDNEDFGFGTMQDVGNQYIQVILGGGEAPWTTLKLAQSYARIVTRRQVKPRIVYSPDAQRAEPLTALNPEGRWTLLQGMIAAASDGGTARAIGALIKQQSGRVPAGQVLQVFGKTGTPTVVQPVRSPLNAVIDQLVGARIIRMLPNRRIGVATATNESASAALVRGARNSKITLPAAMIPRIMDWVNSVEANRRAGRPTPLQIDGNGDLTGIAQNGERQLNRGENAEGGVLALVIGRYCATDTRYERPLAALAITINIQARTQAGHNPSVEAALKILGANGGNNAMMQHLTAAAPFGGQCP